MGKNQVQVRFVETAVRTPTDVAAQDGNVSVTKDEDVTVAGHSGYSGGANLAQKEVYANNSGSPEYLIGITTSMWQNNHPGVEFEYEVRDSNDATQENIFLQASEGLELTIQLNDGWDIYRTYRNAAPFPATVSSSFIIRDEVAST